MKNVGLTNGNSERRVDDSDFIGPPAYGDSICKENLTISVF